jgi:hypothetical protein
MRANTKSKWQLSENVSDRFQPVSEFSIAAGADIQAELPVRYMRLDSPGSK